MSQTSKKDDITTIQINKATRDELKKHGIKGDTYDEIIRRLLELAKNKPKLETSQTD